MWTVAAMSLREFGVFFVYIIQTWNDATDHYSIQKNLWGSDSLNPRKPEGKGVWQNHFKTAVETIIT